MFLSCIWNDEQRNGNYQEITDPLQRTYVCLFIWMKDMVEGAPKGTQSVIIAAAEAKCRRVVYTSSIGAVYMDPNRHPDIVVDESCWSDLEFCKKTKVHLVWLMNHLSYRSLVRKLIYQNHRLNCVLSPWRGKNMMKIQKNKWKKLLNNKQ